jgi:hypothetical protein
MKLQFVVCLAIGLLTAAPIYGQSFGTAKEKVTLMRKLPALVHLTGTTIEVRMEGHTQHVTLPTQ